MKMGLIKKFSRYRRKGLEEWAELTGKTKFEESGLPEKEKLSFVKGYKTAYVDEKEGNLPLKLYVAGLFTFMCLYMFLGSQIIESRKINEIEKYYKTREKTIIESYEKNKLPSDINLYYNNKNSSNM